MSGTPADSKIASTSMRSLASVSFVIASPISPSAVASWTSSSGGMTSKVGQGASSGSPKLSEAQ
jgi:hypothetical protein